MMYKFLAIFLFFFAICNIQAQTLHIDATDDNTLQQSFFNMLTQLPENQQEAFANAMAVIGVSMSIDKNPSPEKFKQLVHNKTASQIIQTAQKLSPQTRRRDIVIDGTSPQSFNDSISQIILNLPDEARNLFSQALGEIMVDLQKKKKDEKEIYPLLNGKTADEVILMVNPNHIPNIDVKASKALKDYTIEPMSDEETKKLREAKKEEEILLNTDFNLNLVP